MYSIKASAPSNNRQRWVVTGLLAVVIIAGIASFILSGNSEKSDEQIEEFQIVDIVAPPPPPPPPPDEEKIEEEVEDPIEPLDMSEAPDTASEESTEVDLGFDIGDLISSEGSGGFEIDPRRFGRGGGGGDGEGGVFGDESETPPIPVNRTQPVYPSSLLKKGIGGKVIISCTVSAEGQVSGATIKQSSGQAELDKAALNAVSRWKFKPAKRAGKNLKATCNVPFTFEVKKS